MPGARGSRDFQAWRAETRGWAPVGGGAKTKLGPLLKLSSAVNLPRVGIFGGLSEWAAAPHERGAAECRAGPPHAAAKGMRSTRLPIHTRLFTKVDPSRAAPGSTRHPHIVCQRERNAKLRRPTLSRVVMEDELVGVTRYWVARFAPLVLAAGLMSGCASVADSTVLNVGCNPEPALGTPPMPSPQRLATPLAFSFNNIRLYPPSAALSPKISAERAWNAVVHTRDPAHGLQQNGRYSLVLAEWNSKDPTVVSSPGSGERLLVWLVIGRHIWVSTLTGANHVRSPRCIYESAMWPVNATSGQLYGQMAYPPSAEALH